MDDVELVIKIDEKLYKDIYSDAEIMIYGGMRSGKTLLATLLRVIRNGTPLPKGHGKLKDTKDMENNSIKMVTNAEEAEEYQISENISKGFEAFTKMMFKQGQVESEDKDKE